MWFSLHANITSKAASLLVATTADNRVFASVDGAGSSGTGGLAAGSSTCTMLSVSLEVTSACISATVTTVGDSS